MEMMTPRAIYFLEWSEREGKMVGPNEQWAVEFAIVAPTPVSETKVLGSGRLHDGPEHNDEADRNSEKSRYSQIGVVVTNHPNPVRPLVSLGHISAPCYATFAPNTTESPSAKTDPETNVLPIALAGV